MTPLAIFLTILISFILVCILILISIITYYAIINYIHRIECEIITRDLELEKIFKTYVEEDDKNE